MKQGIVVCFPGTGYTCREALFSMCAGAYEKRGYDAVRLDYGSIPFREIESIGEAVALAVRAGKKQLAGVDFSEYADAVWISKSLGTFCAAVTEKDLDVRPRHLMLTPVPQALQALSPNAEVIAMVLGTQDRFLSGEALADYCLERGYRYCMVDGVGHNLKNEADPERTERINRQIAALCEQAAVGAVRKRGRAWNKRRKVLQSATRKRGSSRSESSPCWQAATGRTRGAERRF